MFKHVYKFIYDNYRKGLGLLFIIIIENLVD